MALPKLASAADSSPCIRSNSPLIRWLSTEQPQGREELWRLADLLTQRPGPGAGASYFRGTIALGRLQRHGQTELHGQFLLGTLRGVGHTRQQRQGLGEVGNGLLMGQQAPGLLPGLLHTRVGPCLN